MSTASSTVKRLWQRLRKGGRRLGKLAAFPATAAGYTLYAAASMRRAEEDRPRARALHQQRGARLLLGVLGVRVTVSGNTRALIGNDRPRLLACNHLGVLDPFVLASKLRAALIGKAEIDDWPGGGWVARTMGVVFVKRSGSRAQVEAFVERVQERLQSGVDVLVFPEGTTNSRPNVLPFRTGAFEGVAGHQGEAVLPLYLHVRSVNSRPATLERRGRVIWAEDTETFPEHCWKLLGLRSVHMEIHVGEPIRAAGRGRKALARLAQEHVEALGREALGAAAFREGYTPERPPQ